MFNLLQLQLLEVYHQFENAFGASLGGGLNSVVIERYDDARPQLCYADFKDEYGGIEFYALLRSARYEEWTRSRVCSLMRGLDRMVELKDKLLEHRARLADLVRQRAPCEDTRVAVEKLEIGKIKRALHEEEWAWAQALEWMRAGWLRE